MAYGFYSVPTVSWHQQKTRRQVRESDIALCKVEAFKIGSDWRIFADIDIKEEEIGGVGTIGAVNFRSNAKLAYYHERRRGGHPVQGQPSNHPKALQARQAKKHKNRGGRDRNIQGRPTKLPKPCKQPELPF